LKLAFICHRWKGNELYVKDTKTACSIVSREIDVVPVSTALLFNGFLDDDVGYERDLGIDFGLQILAKCDVLYLYGNHGISEGMKREIEMANHLKIPIEVKDAD